MKVLWFSNTPALGAAFIDSAYKLTGTGGWLYSLNKVLQTHVSLHVVFHYPYKLGTFKYQKTTYYPVYTGNILVENLKIRFFGKVYDDDFLHQYLQIIKEVNPDIIHIHGTENSFLCILDKTKVPVVISIQGNLSVCYQKFLSGFHSKHIGSAIESINIKTILFGRNSFRRGYLNMKSMSVIERKHLIGAKHIIGRTYWDRRVSRVLAPHSNYYVGNEMLRDGFYENQWHNKNWDGKIIIFTTNGNSYYKGFETLCHALHLLNNLGINVEWRVAGISKYSLINHITMRELGKQYPNKGLVIMGSLSENALIMNLQESHIYVMTSHIENSPNNLCEAMILGMPCIATFAGGTGAIMKDGEDGILIQDGDPWVMAGAIIELIKDPEKATRYGLRAREIAISRHNREKIINDLLITYEKIISS